MCSMSMWNRNGNHISYIYELYSYINIANIYQILIYIYIYIIGIIIIIGIANINTNSPGLF